MTIVDQPTSSLDSDAEGVGGLLLIREWKPGRDVRAYLPLTDGLGSICGLIDASDGSLAAEYDYDPYGNPVVGCGPAMDACPFRHRTRYYDPETWLYYYGYRYYDPSVTKWIFYFMGHRTFPEGMFLSAGFQTNRRDLKNAVPGSLQFFSSEDQGAWLDRQRYIPG